MKDKKKVVKLEEYDNEKQQRKAKIYHIVCGAAGAAAGIGVGVLGYRLLRGKDIRKFIRNKALTNDIYNIFERANNNGPYMIDLLAPNNADGSRIIGNVEKAYEEIETLAGKEGVINFVSSIDDLEGLIVLRR